MIFRTRIFHIAAIAAATSASATPPADSGPWDLMLTEQRSIVAKGMERAKCEEGLRLAVRAGHSAVCLRYIDSARASANEEQRYSGVLYPVTSVDECAIVKRSLGQVECIFR